MTATYARWLEARTKQKTIKGTLRAIDEEIKKTIKTYHENQVIIYFSETSYYIWHPIREDPSFYGRHYLQKGFNVKLFSDRLVIDWSETNE